MDSVLRIPIEPDQNPGEDFFSAAYGKGWTDGLPVIPPTRDRIKQFLATVNRDPDEVLAVVPPRHGAASLTSIAANAVMAGCLPEYFPTVVAAFEAINDPLFPLGTLGGTKPETPFFLMNGPVRQRIDLNYTNGCLGPGSRANATIGRALRLIMLNLGGLTIGRHSRSAFSSPMQYTFCAGEDEENSLWEPFHVERSFAREQSVVSVFRVTSYIALLAPLDFDQSPEGLLQHVAQSMVSLGNTALYAGNLSCLLLFNPERVQVLANAGITKSQAKSILFNYMQMPVSSFRRSDVEVMNKRGRIVGDKITLVDRADDIHIAVMGGAGFHAVFLPGFSHQILPHAPVSKRIADN
jgi:hypothetical protein